MRLLMRAAALALIVASSALAHQAKESVTRVLFNERTGNVEVMHRFLVHDAEHAVRQVVGNDADILKSEQAREQFARYVDRHFSLHAQGGVELALASVGHEIDGKYLWVYSQAAIPAELGEITVRHSALQDIWPEQSNLVNIERGDFQHSMLFVERTGSLTVSMLTE